MTDTRQILTRDGRYRIELTLTERDLAMHADAAYSAPEIFEVESGASIFRLPADTWDAITTIPWGESGVQFRLARIESGTEYFLVVDPARRRYCLDPGLELRFWNDELPEDNVAWHDGWEAIHETINEVFLRPVLDAVPEKDEPTPAAQIVAKPSIAEISQPSAPPPPPLLPENLTISRPVLQGFTIDYEEVELSMVHKVYYGSVIDCVTGRAVFSLPSGLWDQADARLENGTVMVDFSPASGVEGRVLRYDPASGRIRHIHGATGKAGPWLPANDARAAWDGLKPGALGRTKRSGCLPLFMSIAALSAVGFAIEMIDSWAS